VHHASNEQYRDRNFGNVLIIFDRLFGTFKEEQEEIEIRFGITDNIHSYDPVTVIFHEWRNILKNTMEE
jgi:sterol desaturase/sphingolipid hydroxylase (fatty acid hydroxylase superfamily)